jgi:hypothetical protein
VSAVPQAVAEADGSEYWPREAYPAAEDALLATARHGEAWWACAERGVAEQPDTSVRLVWLRAAVPGDGAPEPEWWWFEDEPAPGRAECWEVAPTRWGRGRSLWRLGWVA